MRSVPPCACSKTPLRCDVAPVNAPRSWPKSSDSTRFGGTAVQSKTTNGPLRARAPVVERLGEDLLAGAGLALDDDRDVARGEALAERIEAAHLDARADDAPERRGARERDLLRGRERVDAEHRACPMWTISPPSRSASNTRTPETNVPLRDSRSTRRKRPPLKLEPAWRRDTVDRTGGSRRRDLARATSVPASSHPRGSSRRCPDPRSL